MKRLTEIGQQRSTVGDVRGMGLMIGVELTNDDGSADPAAMTHVKQQSLEEGMFILSCGPANNIIRFIPPLVATIDDIDTGIDILDRALASYEA